MDVAELNLMFSYIGAEGVDQEGRLRPAVSFEMLHALDIFEIVHLLKR